MNEVIPLRIPGLKEQRQTGITILKICSSFLGKISVEAHWDGLLHWYEGHEKPIKRFALTDVRYIFHKGGQPIGSVRPQDLEPWFSDALNKELVRQICPRDHGTVVL